MEITTREFAIEDYVAALELWQRAEGVEVSEGDDRKSIALFIKKNPGLSRVAVQGAKIIGVALCGHDGRRGYIYHLAVDPDHQRFGLGKRLVDECLDGLRQAGVQRALIMVADDNPKGREFWKRCGWEWVDGALVMGKDV